MLPTAVFSKGKKVTDHYSILALKTVGFSKGCCHYELNKSIEQMVKSSFISLYCIHGIEINIFMNRKFATIYKCSTLHEKRESWQECHIWLSPLCKLF